MPRRKAAEEVAETKEIVAAEPTEKKKRGRKPAGTVSEDTGKKAAAVKTETKAEEDAADIEAAAPKAEKKTGKKTEEKPAAVKKAEPEVSAVIQCRAGQVTVKDLTAAAAEAYKAAHEGAEIDSITIYIKPEENAVYYVVNGDDSEGNNKLTLI